MRSLIVTGDDFGLAVPVNEAIQVAHQQGILNTASLMVGAPAAKDAVERAMRLPTLRVGLHLVLVEGGSTLPPERIPDLVSRQGEFSSRLILTGLKYFFLPGVRRQLEDEIRAQLDQYCLTGLPLDHINAHNHFQLHPTVLEIILRVGKEYGLRAMRVPYEPFWQSWRMGRQHGFFRFLSWLMLAPWMGLLRLKLRRAGIHSNDFAFGLYDSGHMTQQRVMNLLSYLPHGVTEVYFHPATQSCPELERTMADYEHEREFETLICPDIKRMIASMGIHPWTFSEL
ncbi:MAG: hopanoid biosynthesis-associated protein HpnK [Nitrospirales bacterium]|nr:hopanoid biosynthesis-associated protein HpnK [Nitrospirales bacterium]